MKLVAQKPCNFGGKKYFIGQEIPAEYVINPKAHAAMGTLSIVEEEKQVEAKITVRVADFYLNVTQEGLQAVVDVMTATAKDAEPIIAQITDGDALILLHACDSRKTIKEAVEERAKSLVEEDVDPEELQAEELETVEDEDPEEDPTPEESAGEQ